MITQRVKRDFSGPETLRNAPNAPNAPGAPGVSGDAGVSVEGLLVWAYRDQLVHVADRGGDDDFAAWAGGGGQSVFFFEAMRLGFVIPSTGGGRVGGGIDWHADALRVHQAVTALPDAMARLVILYAVKGARPAPERPRWSPRETIVGADGVERPRALYAKRGRKVPWLTPVACSHTWAEIEAGRARWRDWRAALAILSGHFRAHPHALTRWRVTDSLPPLAAWPGGVVQPMRRGS